MILGPMIAVAMAGALALPATGGASVADTSPPAAPTNPLVSLAGAGFAAIGDLMHAVPILGPLATDIGVGAFCAASFVPVVGDVTKASVSKFDKDQKQGNGCASSSSSAGSSSGKSATGSVQGASAANGTPASDRPAASDRTSVADRTSDADHKADADHRSDADHTSATDHGRASASGNDRAKTVTFPADHFQLRRGGAVDQDCLVKGPGSSAVYGPCDAAAAWTFQFSTGELRPAGDEGTCLVASAKDFGTVSVSSCSGVTPWTSHWYVSQTHRLFVRDADDHDSWRYLGAHDALVVGSVTSRDFPALPVWTFAGV